MQDVSFLPQDYQKRRMTRRSNVISLTLFAIVMTAIIGAYVTTDRQRDEVRAQLDLVNQEFEDAARRLDQLDELRLQKLQIVRKANVTSVLLERISRSLVLAELVNRMPEKVSLINLKFETKVVRTISRAKTAMDKAREEKKAETAAQSDLPELPVLKPTVVNIVLIGMAKTDIEVAQYMTRLSRSSMFNDVNLAFSQEAKAQDVPMRKFSVAMTLNQSVNVQKF
jgi:Tfp pilus assembly protein PilN